MRWRERRIGSGDGGSAVGESVGGNVVGTRREVGWMGGRFEVRMLGSFGHWRWSLFGRGGRRCQGRDAQRVALH